MTAQAPEVARRPGTKFWLVAVSGLAAVLLAGVVGHAIAGGFTTESAPGQEVSDRVMKAWATGDTAAITAAYDPAVKFVLEYPGRPPGEGDTANAEQLTATIAGAIAIGNTYKQIGPVSYYETSDGDVYVATLVEVTGGVHPVGVPVVGFYRVHDGKVIQHIVMDVDQY